jgi:hypothetical protein
MSSPNLRYGKERMSEAERRESLGDLWTLDEMLAFLEDVVEVKVKHRKCLADEREMELAFLMRVFWHRARPVQTQ